MANENAFVMPANVQLISIRHLYGQTWSMRLLVHGLLIAFVGFACFPFCINGLFPMTHEAERYVVLSTHFRHALEAGFVYPRWLPLLAGGMGYPTFCFYQPLFFYLSSLLTKLFQTSDTNGIFLSIIVSLILGVNGFYFAARHWANVFWSLVATFFFILTPYLYINLYVRGDLSEFLSIIILPWSLAFLFRTIACSNENRTLWPSSLGLAISLALVVLSHPTTALAWFAVFPCLIMAAILTASRQTRFALTCALATSFLFALALSMPYWEPVFRLKPFVELDQAVMGYYVSARHVVGLHQFFMRGWGFGGSVPDSYDDTMSLQLGLPHFILALIGLYFGRKQRLLVTSAVLYFLLIFAMSSFTFVIWVFLKPLSWFQFPWRLFAVVAPIQSILIVGCCQSSEWQSKLKIGVVAMAIFATWFYWPQFKLNDDFFKTTEDVQKICDKILANSLYDYKVYAGQNEFLPRTALPGVGYYRADRPIVDALNPASITPLPDHSPFRIHVQIEVDQPQSVIIRQYYFPGWHVEVNGTVIDDVGLGSLVTEHGLITAPVPAGKSELIAYYAGPPGGGLRVQVILLIGILFIAVQIVLQRRLKSQSST